MKHFYNILHPRHSRGKSTALKHFFQMFYFTCNYLLSSTCVQHAKTFAKMFCNIFAKKNIFANVLAKTFTKHF